MSAASKRRRDLGADCSCATFGGYDSLCVIHGPRAQVASPADIPPTADQPPPDISPDHRYHAAFDAVAAIFADLVLDELYHPGATAALVSWAAARGKSVVQRYAAGWPAGMLSVAIGTPGTTSSRSFDVYMR